MSGEDSEPDPVKRAPLKNYVKQFTDKRAGSDAIDELEAEMLFISKIIWQEASQRAEDRGLNTVQEQDVEGAYNDLFEPHQILHEASNEIGDLGQKIEVISDRSPIYKTWDSNEE